jgi:hypothetical protein
MDPQTKSAIKSLVLDLRHTLEDELAIVLKLCSAGERRLPIGFRPDFCCDVSTCLPPCCLV